MKDDLSQKNTWKYDIFFKYFEKVVFSKRIAPGHDLSCTVWKGGIFSWKHRTFFLDGKREWDNLPKKYTETWYFLFDMLKDDPIPQKYT